MSARYHASESRGASISMAPRHGSDVLSRRDSTHEPRRQRRSLRPRTSWLAAPAGRGVARVAAASAAGERAQRRLTVCLLPGDPHALLLEDAVASFRPDALDRLGLTARESEVLLAATVIEGEAELAWGCF
jgi:hypothetical protein